MKLRIFSPHATGEKYYNWYFLKLIAIHDYHLKIINMRLTTLFIIEALQKWEKVEFKCELFVPGIEYISFRRKKIMMMNIDTSKY